MVHLPSTGRGGHSKAHHAGEPPTHRATTIGVKSLFPVSDTGGVPESPGVSTPR